jgi:hypothetical protein
MSATVDNFALLHAMPDYPALAVGTGWSQGMNRTFETIKDVFFSADTDFERLVIVVSASFTFSHFDLLNLISIPGDRTVVSGQLSGIAQREVQSDS